MGRASGGSKRGAALVFGVLIGLFGALIAWAGYSDYGFAGPFFPGLALALVGVILFTAGLLFPTTDVIRIFAGILTAVLGVGCVVGGLVAAVLGGPGYLPVVPMGFIWLVGSAMCFDLPRRLAASRGYRADEVSKMLGGAVAVFAGLAIAGQVVADSSGMAEGVAPWVGVAAGGVFFLAGVLILAAGREGLASALVLAVFLSLFAALSLALFPPGGLIVAFLAVQGWIVVYRKVHQSVTGRDPLAGMSDERLLGVGCLVFLALLLLVAGGLWLAGTLARPPDAQLRAAVVFVHGSGPQKRTRSAR